VVRELVRTAHIPQQTIELASLTPQ